ncbi:DNA repair protein [Vibrio phage D479]
MSLMDRMKKSSTSGYAKVLSNSELMHKKDQVRTSIPALNLALSGEIDGGLTSGITLFAGPSKHFKTLLGWITVRSFLNKYDDGVCVFLDTEFGTTPDYLKSQGIDPDRVLHIQCENVEQMKFELANQLEEVKREDRVIFFIDSVGNVASKKEVEDAQNQKSVADMSRAKQLKSMFRIATPYCTTRDLPIVAINHTYETQEMFSKTVMSGGTGPMYSADTVIILGKQQEKDGKELVGYNFIMNIEKSRYVKEKSKIPLQVTYEKGVNVFSGLMDIALDLGWVHKPNNRSYQVVLGYDEETGEMLLDEKKWYRKDTDCAMFWKPLITNPEFREAVKGHFSLGQIDCEALEAEAAELFEEM